MYEFQVKSSGSYMVGEIGVMLSTFDILVQEVAVADNGDRNMFWAKSGLILEDTYLDSKGDTGYTTIRTRIIDKDNTVLHDGEPLGLDDVVQFLHDHEVGYTKK